jgi:hypothetical protein
MPLWLFRVSCFRLLFAHDWLSLCLMRARPDGLANGLNVISIMVIGGGYIATARMIAPSRPRFRVPRRPSRTHSRATPPRAQGTGVCQPPTRPLCRNTDTWPRDTNAICHLVYLYGSSQRGFGPSPIQSMR